MHLQPAFEAAEHTERKSDTRRGWSIEELRERLGVTAPASEAEEKRPARRREQEPEAPARRPRIVKRTVAYAMA
jgi:hypothetical protein